MFGLSQVDNMLAVIGTEMDLNATVLSDDERAFLYMRMQQSLRLKNVKKKSGVTKHLYTLFFTIRYNLFLLTNPRTCIPNTWVYKTLLIVFHR